MKIRGFTPENRFMNTTFIIILTVLQLVCMLLIGWSGVVAFLGLIRKRPPRGEETPKNRFAVVVCAKNEEKVLSHLLRSLEAQDYPADHFHVYLLADHCTDGTASLADRFSFVTAWERTDGPQSGKGAVLTWGIGKILRDKADTFDALMVFDADNVARKDFMSRMNEALNKGNDLVQGNRLAGEPYRTFVTKWYATYWPLYSYLYSYPREKLGLSCFLTGTGFAVRKELLREYGWCTNSITEDVEFSFQQCLRHERVSFCEEAVCYDEQPSSVMNMLRQLARWCTGNYQIFFRYIGKWARAFREKPSARLIDNLSLLMLGPCTITITICTILITIMTSRVFPRVWIMQLVMFCLIYIFTLAGVLFITRYAGIPLKKLMPAFLTFPVFLWIYQFCSLYALIFPSKKWKPISHEGLFGEENEEDA